MEKYFADAIEKALKEFVAERWAAHMKKLDQEKDVFIAGMALDLKREIELRSHGDMITITLRKTDAK